MLCEGEAIRHPRDVVRYPPGPALDAVLSLQHAGPPAGTLGEQAEVPVQRVEEAAYHALRLRGHALHLLVAVEVLSQETLHAQVPGAECMVETDEGERCGSDVLDAAGVCAGNPLATRVDEVGYLAVDHASHDLVDHPSQRKLGPASRHFRIGPGERLFLAEVLDRDQPGPQSIVQIMGIVGDFVGEVGDLRFQGGLSAAHEALPHIPEFSGVTWRAMLENAFAGSRMSG